MRKTQVSIILPTYNEAENIVPLIKKIMWYVKKHSFEIIVVDDRSLDGTAQKVKEFIKNKPNINIKLFIKKNQRSLAKSIKLGIDKSQGDLLLIMDTDFNHNPNQIPIFLSEIESYDMVIGSRYIKGGGMENKLRYFFSLIYNNFIRFFLNLPTHDNLSGFFIIKKKLLRKLPVRKIFFGYGDYFIRLLYFASKANLHLKEIPVFYKNRLAGKSKSNFLSMFFSYTQTVINLLKNEK